MAALPTIAAGGRASRATRGHRGDRLRRAGGRRRRRPHRRRERSGGRRSRAGCRRSRSSARRASSRSSRPSGPGRRRADRPRTPLDAVLDTVADAAARRTAVCVLASGDPGFFGIVRALGERFGPRAWPCTRRRPRSRWPSPASERAWDDAAVVSAHGRPVGPMRSRPPSPGRPPVAVLTSPDNPPEAVGQARGRRPAARAGVTVVVPDRRGRRGRSHADLAGLADAHLRPDVGRRRCRPADASSSGPSWPGAARKRVRRTATA